LAAGPPTINNFICTYYILSPRFERFGLRIITVVLTSVVVTSRLSDLKWTALYKTYLLANENNLMGGTTPLFYSGDFCLHLSLYKAKLKAKKKEFEDYIGTKGKLVNYFVHHTTVKNIKSILKNLTAMEASGKSIVY
jgi:hypothetical protein